MAPLVAEELRRLRTFVHVVTFGEAQADAALLMGWGDLGNALVHEAARSVQADAIITRNLTDFSRAIIPALDCPHFFEWFKERTGIDYAEIEF